MNRTILHSDLNNFYASVEMLLNPDLRGKAIAVCRTSDERHGVVLAKSELAKKAGVRTAMVAWEAKRLCPELIFVPPHHEEYHKYSHMVHEIYWRYTDLVEPYGLDECFLDVTESRLLLGDGMQIAEDIRNTIKQELGLTVSIGVSFNKAFAKLGSDMKKPDAVTRITPENFQQLVWPLPASELLYVGKRTGTRLKSLQIQTIGELAAASPEFLEQELGSAGRLLHRYACGEDDAPVLHKDARPPSKSTGHGHTFSADLTTEAQVSKAILSLSVSVARELRKENQSAGGVQLAIRDSKLVTRQFQTQLEFPTQDYLILSRVAQQLFQKHYRWAQNVRSVTVRAIQLTDAIDAQPINFFADTKKIEQRDRLERAADQLEKRFGNAVLTPAALLKKKSGGKPQRG